MDQTLFHLINQRWTNPALDLFMAGLSDYRDLEAAADRRHAGRPCVWRIQGARLSVICILFTLLVVGACYRHSEIGDRSAPSQTGGNRSHGPVTKGPSEISRAFQKTNNPFLGCIRSDALRAVFSIWPHGEQHGDRSLSDTLLSETRLALLVPRRRHRLFANLSRRALAKRYRWRHFPGNREDVPHCRAP